MVRGLNRTTSSLNRSENKAGKQPVAIFSFRMESRPRSAGRSSVSAAAYVLAAEMTDARTGEITDESKKGGVFDAFTLGPAGDNLDPHKLWSAVEMHHKRRDAVPARLFICALPNELTHEQNTEFVKEFVASFTKEYGVAATCGMHLPDRGGDERNVHAHIVYTACSVEPGQDLKFGKKVVELDPICMRQAKLEPPADKLRKQWEIAVNAALAKNGFDERVDCRSLKEQHAEAVAAGDVQKAAKLDRAPTSHLGAAATGFERRTGKRSQIRKDAETALKPSRKTIALLKRQKAKLERVAGIREAPATLSQIKEKGVKSVRGVKQPERVKTGVVIPASMSALIDSRAVVKTDLTRSQEMLKDKQRLHALKRAALETLSAERQAQYKTAQERKAYKTAGTDGKMHSLLNEAQRLVLEFWAQVLANIAQNTANREIAKLHAKIDEAEVKYQILLAQLAESKAEVKRNEAQAEKENAEIIEAQRAKLEVEKLDENIRKLKNGEKTKASRESVLEQSARLGSIERVHEALALGGDISHRTFAFAAQADDPRVMRALKGGMTEEDVEKVMKALDVADDVKQKLDEAVPMKPPSEKTSNLERSRALLASAASGRRDEDEEAAGTPGPGSSSGHKFG